LGDLSVYGRIILKYVLNSWWRTGFTVLRLATATSELLWCGDCTRELVRWNVARHWLNVNRRRDFCTCVSVVSDAWFMFCSFRLFFLKSVKRLSFPWFAWNLNSWSGCLTVVRYVLWFKLTPWGRVLVQKLTVAKLLKKFSAFYGTSRFITMFTRTRHWYLSWARWIQSTPRHPISLRSILILSSHLHLWLLAVLFPKYCVHFSLFQCLLHAPSISSSLTGSPK